MAGYSTTSAPHRNTIGGHCGFPYDAAAHEAHSPLNVRRIVFDRAHTFSACMPASPRYSRLFGRTSAMDLMPGVASCPTFKNEILALGV